MSIPKDDLTTEYAGVILVVDDDDRIRQLLARYMQQHKFLVLAAEDAIQARVLLAEFSFDLIILDIMMPGENGKELTENIRDSITTPILMLTAMSEVGDRIVGLEVGADDYMAKPFEPKELLLRAQKLIYRTKKAGVSQADIVTKLGDLEYNHKNKSLSKGNQLIELTSTETKLLSILIDNLGKPVQRELLSKLSGGVNDRSIDVQIIRLRHKIELDPKKPRYLQTAWGEGYVLYD